MYGHFSPLKLGSTSTGSELQRLITRPGSIAELLNILMTLLAK